MSQTYNINEDSIQTEPYWTKNDILSRVSQEEIFEYYLDRPVEYNTRFCSPLRTDNHPTCTFKKMTSGTLLYRDWAEPRPKDCFNLVQEIFNVDFATALQIIARDLGLTDKEPNIGKNSYNRDDYQKNKPVHSEKSIIRVRTQSFTRTDAEYLKSYHLTKKILDAYNVYSIHSAWINGKNVYAYSKDNPAIGYYFGKDEEGHQKWKIYKYKSDSSYRFMGNTNRINGWIQIPQKGENLLITKSMKDVMCLARFSIPSIAMQAETQIPYDYIIEELKERFKNIYTLLDFDRTGVISANKIKRLYDIPPLMLTDGRFGSIDFGHKDFSDFLQANGIEQTGQLIHWTEEHMDKMSNMFPVLNTNKQL